jgi:hypothetical protein
MCCPIRFFSIYSTLFLLSDYWFDLIKNMRNIFTKRIKKSRKNTSNVQLYSNELIHSWDNQALFFTNKNMILQQYKLYGL